MNSWGIPVRRTDYELRERIALGFQCQDCYGVRVTLQPRQPHDPHRYLCEECGCQWTGH
jgi:hypothetical protein